jgi:hypothetical protein
MQRLRSAQVMTILRSRIAHLDKLMTLYHERAALGRQALEAATAMHSGPAPGLAAGFQGGGGADDSMLSVLMKQGYLSCARHVVNLSRIMEMFKVREARGGAFVCCTSHA